MLAGAGVIASPNPTSICRRKMAVPGLAVSGTRKPPYSKTIASPRQAEDSRKRPTLSVRTLETFRVLRPSCPVFKLRYLFLPGN